MNTYDEQFANLEALFFANIKASGYHRDQSRRKAILCDILAACPIGQDVLNVLYCTSAKERVSYTKIHTSLTCPRELVRKSLMFLGRTGFLLASETFAPHDVAWMYQSDVNFDTLVLVPLFGVGVRKSGGIPASSEQNRSDHISFFKEAGMECLTHSGVTGWFPANALHDFQFEEDRQTRSCVLSGVVGRPRYRFRARLQRVANVKAKNVNVPEAFVFADTLLVITNNANPRDVCLFFMDKLLAFMAQLNPHHEHFSYWEIPSFDLTGGAVLSLCEDPEYQWVARRFN